MSSITLQGSKYSHEYSVSWSSEEEGVKKGGGGEWWGGNNTDEKW